LIKYYDDNKVELYNLAQDIFETQDVAVANPAVIQRLLTLMTTQLEDRQAKYPVVNPEF